MNDDILNAGTPQPDEVPDKPSEQPTEHLAESTEPEKKEKRPRRTVGSIVKNLLVILVFALIFSVGLVVMFYPSISNYVNQKNQSRAMDTYRESIAQLDTTDYESYLDAARAYNAKLASDGSAVRDAFVSAAYGEEKTGEYWQLLSVNGEKVMGYVSIDILDVEIPLYHGTDEIVLSQGAGHLQGTSLPIGGESTHTALSAHTGLPSGKFFDNIDRLQIGDTFQIHVMNEILTYQVDQILTVLPEEMDGLSIEEGSDFATLITCTPYGINSHRLLVRGTRIETPPEQLITETGSAAQEVQQQQAPDLFTRARDGVVVGLANAVEAVAKGIVSVTEWGMDFFGVAY